MSPLTLQVLKVNPAQKLYERLGFAMSGETFDFGGNLSLLKDAQRNGRALVGAKAITFVRNHDIDRGQAHDRGIDDSTFGVGWDEGERKLNRTDVNLAYAFLFGREDGFPYVFADMPTLPQEQQDDRFDDPQHVAGIDSTISA